MMRKLLFHRLLLPVLFALSCSCLAADTPKLTVIADREMPKYQCGETVVFYISAVNADGAPITSGTLDYQLKLCSRCDLTLRSGKIELGEKPVEFKATLEEPGFLYLRVSGTLDGKKLWAAGGAAFLHIIPRRTGEFHRGSTPGGRERRGVFCLSDAIIHKKAALRPPGAPSAVCGRAAPFGD